MRRWLIAVSLLGLVACEEKEAAEPRQPEAAELRASEATEPKASEATEPREPEPEAMPRTVQTANGPVECNDGWECSCVKHTTRDTCVKNKPPCFWHEDRCKPTYE